MSANPAEQITAAASEFVITKLILDGMAATDEACIGIEAVTNGVLGWLASRAADAGVEEELRSVLISALAADQVKGTYRYGPGHSDLT